MDDSQFNLLIETLEHIKNRPGMHFSDSLAPVDNFVSGFDTAMRIFLDHRPIDAVFEAMREEGGWSHNKSLYQQLIQRGFDEEQAINEYFSLLIENYKRWRAQT